nr:reverse transcriptase domain-containing protein [Tanacetum cinerariifolium]
MVRAFTIGANEKKAYVGNLPYYNKCRLYHVGSCTMKYNNCKRVGHKTKNCRTFVPVTTQRALVANQEPTKRKEGKTRKNSNVVNDYADA